MGILVAGIEALHRSLRQGEKRHYQNQRDFIPYHAYVYIDIHCNQNEVIHCNTHFWGVAW